MLFIKKTQQLFQIPFPTRRCFVHITIRLKNVNLPTHQTTWTRNQGHNAQGYTPEGGGNTNLDLFKNNLVTNGVIQRNAIPNDPKYSNDPGDFGPDQDDFGGLEVGFRRNNHNH